MVTRISIRDREWVRKAFFLGDAENLSEYDRERRFFTTASFKFTDSSLGGNFCINPVPQFTPSADIRVTPAYGMDSNGKIATPNVRYANLQDPKGMGRFYSEAFDDNAQVIHMRFGVAKYNSMTNFFTGFYNREAGQIARTGRSGGLFYLLGRAIGMVVMVAAWQIVVIGMAAHALKFLMGKPVTKYYYLKPTMPVYWTAVTNMVNQISVNKGMIPRAFSKEVVNSMGEDYNFSEQERKEFAALAPDIFREDGSIDIYAVANRAQRKARLRRQAQEQAMRSGADFPSVINTILAQDLAEEKIKGRPLSNPVKLDADGNPLPSSLAGSVQGDWFTGVGGEVQTTTTNEKGETVTITSVDTFPDQISVDAKGEVSQNDKISEGFWSRTLSMWKAELEDGSAFASFRVDSTGQVNESFSSSVMDSEISSKINGMSASSRNTNFNFANGNLIGGVFGEVLGSALGAVKNVVGGIGDQLSLSGLAVLGGAAFVDIPKTWDNSSASLPRASYNIKLISPYGNPMSQLINIDIPLSMLLAAALPLSTGPQSYTSPFLVELYDRGRCQTRLGIIDSMSITRGTSNLGFTNKGRALAIDVSFSVLDLSSIMHMPIISGFTLNPTKAFFSDENSFTDYMSVLSGMGLEDQIYENNKMLLRLTRQMAHWRSFFSASHLASAMGDNSFIPPSTLFKIFARNNARI